MCDIIVYLAMFSTTIDKILSFMDESLFFSLGSHLELGISSGTKFELFPTEAWDFFLFFEDTFFEKVN